MTDKVEQIKNEIKRLLNEPAPSHDSQCKWEDGYWCALYKIEEFIDSLQEEPVSEDLEEEITKCYKSRNDLMMTRKQFGELIHRFTGWQKKQMLSEMPVSEDLEDPCSCCQGFCNKEKCDELIFGYRCPVLNVIQSLELGFENAVEKASEWLKDFCNEHYIMSYTDSSEVVYEKLIEIFKSKMEENK